jgi:hypothetical protein
MEGHRSLLSQPERTVVYLQRIQGPLWEFRFNPLPRPAFVLLQINQHCVFLVVGYRNLSCGYIVVDEARDIALPRSPWFTDFHLIQSMVTVLPYAVRSCFAARGNCKVCIEYR